MIHNRATLVICMDGENTVKLRMSIYYNDPLSGFAPSLFLVLILAGCSLRYVFLIYHAVVLRLLTDETGEERAMISGVVRVGGVSN